METGNPYVGPRAFQPGEKLYGRDRELAQLRELLIAERILLLYSPSGAGKTSLIQAALIPELEQRFDVLPIARVIGEAVEGRGNRYSRSALANIVGHEADVEPRSELPLTGYLRDRIEPGKRSILIFDQFEEVLTADAVDRAGRTAFFKDLSEALQLPNLFVLFAMREDYIAGLDPYRLQLPTQLRNRMRLGFLEPDAARAAMQNPAKTAGVAFPDEVAQALVEELRRAPVASPTPEAPQRLLPSIEPLHLQIICLRLWQENEVRWKDGGERRLELAEAGSAVNVDHALGAYYDDTVQKVAIETGGSDALRVERGIRDWFDRRLITPEGVRSQVLRSSEQASGLSDAAIGMLVGAYLIRAEEARGATWYELAHDRLVGPVRRRNAEWFATNLAPVERQAQVWRDQERGADFLITGEKLDEALAWAEWNPGRLSQLEQQFLDQCLQARNKERRERRRTRTLLGTLSVLLVAVSGLFYQYEKGQDIQVQKDMSDAKVVDVSAKLRDADLKLRDADLRAKAIVAESTRKAQLIVDEAEARVAKLEREMATREMAFRKLVDAARQRERHANAKAAQAEGARRMADLRAEELARGSEIRNQQLAEIYEQIRLHPERGPELLAQLFIVVSKMGEDEPVETAPKGRTSVCLKLWPVGKVLRVRFLDGSADLRAKVLGIASQWSESANLRFVASNDPDAEVRVTFRRDGAWSFVGTDALTASREDATMNLGTVAGQTVPDSYIERIVLHEFGHILGLIHEQQNPNAQIPWKREAVFAYYSAPPNNWPREMVEANILHKADISGYRPFDPNSVMIYGAFPQQLFENGFELRAGDTLSASDRAFAARLYPRSGARQC